MKVRQWFSINRKGITTTRKSKPTLKWDEIAIEMEFNIPDELFKRPTISATLTIKDVPNTAYQPDIIINTKELIEQQTGAKIEMRIVNVTDEAKK